MSKLLVRRRTVLVPCGNPHRIELPHKPLTDEASVAVIANVSLGARRHHTAACCIRCNTSSSVTSSCQAARADPAPHDFFGQHVARAARMSDVPGIPVTRLGPRRRARMRGRSGPRRVVGARSRTGRWSETAESIRRHRVAQQGSRSRASVDCHRVTAAKRAQWQWRVPRGRGWPA